MTNEYPVLIVEDVDSKFLDVMSCLQEVFEGPVVHARATNLNEAEDRVMEGRWRLLILDLSMDIASSGSIGLGSGHATLGGLDVLERVALMKMELPTLLVTGFDSFQDSDRFDNAIMNISDVDELAGTWLPMNYLGCVRYGVERWEDAFKAKVLAWRNS